MAVGWTRSSAQPGDFALVRYNADGSLDTGFGANGLVTTDFGASADRINAAILQPNGKIIGVGWSIGVGGNSNAALARYNADGSLDASFGTGGKVVKDFGSTTDFFSSVARQPDGKIIAVGRSGYCK